MLLTETQLAQARRAREREAAAAREAELEEEGAQWVERMRERGVQVRIAAAYCMCVTGAGWSEGSGWSALGCGR